MGLERGEMVKSDQEPRSLGSWKEASLHVQVRVDFKHVSTNEGMSTECGRLVGEARVRALAGRT